MRIRPGAAAGGNTLPGSIDRTYVRPLRLAAGTMAAVMFALGSGVTPVSALAQEDIARAAESRSLAGEPPILGCGKSQALLRALTPDPEGIPSAAYLEALADTDVLHYDLDIEVTDLIPPPTNRCTITGTNVITIQSKTAGLTEFQFRLRSQFTITSAVVNGTTPVTVTTLSTSTRRAELDRAYALDEVFTLAISYTGNTVSAAFGSIDVATQPGTGTLVVGTLSEPYYAYTWWPVKDGDVGVPGDNSDKSTVDLAVTVNGAYQVPANGLLQGVDTLSGGRKRYRWSTAYPIATYLVSFGATTYNTWTRNYTHPGGTMPVEFYIYPGLDNGTNRAAWDKVVNMLGVFASAFGEYPFIDEKYGIYNFPFGGGMEHQTMTGQGGFSESLNSHELAHQWWGDMITCKTWSDIWLNEGFAEYSECIWEEFKTGADNLPAYLNAIRARKPGFVGGSVYVYPADTASVSRIFDGNLSYLKGAWVLHQLRGVVGDEVFFRILADYRAAYEFGAATTEDFIAVAEGTYGADLDWFFQQWVYEIGAPAYQYGWQSTAVDGKNYLLARITQSQVASYPNVFTMPVPLRVTVDGVPQTHTVWNDARTQWFVQPLGAPATTVQFDPDEWILRSSVSGVSYVPGPPKIVVTNPLPGGIWGKPDGPRRIAITFHTPVNASAGDFTVTGQDTGPTPFTIGSAPGANPVWLDFAQPLEFDTYTVTVAETVTAVDSGMALDGEIVNPASPISLPSGDGLAGGASLWRFEVRMGVPATSAWGLMALALCTTVAASILLRRRPARWGATDSSPPS